MLAALTAGLIIGTPFYRSHKEVTANGTLLRAVNTHDMAQHLAVMEQFDMMLRTGVLYPRWLPDVNKGYGIAWTNFYPPGFYYVTAIAILRWVRQPATAQTQVGELSREKAKSQTFLWIVMGLATTCAHTAEGH